MWHRVLLKGMYFKPFWQFVFHMWIQCCVPMCWLQLKLTTGCLKGYGEWQEKWREKAKHRRGQTQEVQKGKEIERKKEREKLRVEGEWDRAGTLDLGYELAVGRALLCSVCFCSIFTVQSDFGHWWMTPYVSYISSRRNHSGCLAPGRRGGVLRRNTMDP